MDNLIKPIIHVAIPAVVMLHVVNNGLLDAVKTEDGLEHYAEKPVFPSMPTVMPLNAIVNLGYSVAGLAWLISTYRAVKEGVIRTGDRYYFHMFAWMAVFYGPAQMMRILTQHHRWAIYDQWVTLPFFSWTVCWGIHIYFGTGGLVNFVISLVSMSSYILALRTPIGFEISLSCHITIAVLCGMLNYSRYPSSAARNAFIMTCLSCGGFVGLKLLDLHLPEISSVFEIASGHFLSKICDVMQIHFVAQFFYCILRAKYHAEKRA